NSFRRDPNQHRTIEKIDDVSFLIEKALIIQSQIDEKEKNNRENKIDFSSQDLTWINQKTSELQRCYKRALQLDPENPKLYFLQGALYFKANKLKDAIHFFETGLKLDPSYPMSNPDIAIVLCKVYRADSSKSKVFYEIAKKAFPENVQVQELGKILKL
ncbi:MAG: tetratricopeptide repeat protein, partial [Candidatus Absconditabacteria bacterium]